MKLRIATAVLVLSSFAGAIDGKSLTLGIGLGAGMFVTRNYIALPVAHATVKVAKKTARATIHVVTLGHK